MLVCVLHSPAKYRECALLSKLVKTYNIETHVYFHSIDKGDHDWLKLTTFSYTKIDYGYKSLFTLIRLLTLALKAKMVAKRKFSLFWIAGWDNPINILTILYCVVFKVKYMLFTDTLNTGFRKPNVFEIIRYKLLVFSLCHAFRIGTTGKPGLAAFDYYNYFGAQKAKFINFHYYIDLKKFKPLNSRIFAESHYKDAQSVKLVSVGWLKDYLKGQGIIIRACSRIPRDINFQLTFVGSGPDLEKLERLTLELKLVGRVRFVGQKSSDEVAMIYKQSDILIHASPIHEPYGVVIQEAMASGVAVFASDRTCAALDSIVSGENGFIHEAGNDEMLAAQLLPFLRNSSLLAGIRRRSYRTAKKWDINRGAALLHSILTAR